VAAPCLRAHQKSLQHSTAAENILGSTRVALRERKTVTYVLEVLLRRRRVARGADGRQAEQPAEGTPAAGARALSRRARFARLACSLLANP